MNKVFTITTILSYTNDSDCNGSFTHVCRKEKTARKIAKEIMTREINAYYEGGDDIPSAKEIKEMVKAAFAEKKHEVEVGDLTITIRIDTAEIRD